MNFLLIINKKKGQKQTKREYGGKHRVEEEKNIKN